MHPERSPGGGVEGVAAPLNQASGGTGVESQDLPPAGTGTVLAVSWLPGPH